MGDKDDHKDNGLIPSDEMQLFIARISFRLAQLSKIILESMERSVSIGRVAYSEEDERLTRKIREEMMQITSTLLGMDKLNEP